MLREKLGGGNFGAAFEGVKLEVGLSVAAWKDVLVCYALIDCA